MKLIRRMLPTALILLSLGMAAAQDTLRIGIVLPDDDGPVTRSAVQGATFAAEEFALNASLFGIELDVVIRQDDDPAAAAAELIEEGVIGLAGGLDYGSALALSQAAAAAEVPFLNIAAPADSLRNAQCSAYTFHIAPSAAQYLDAIGGWYIRAGFRDWFIVVGEDQESQDQLQRTLWMLNNRHFGARERGIFTMAPGQAEEAAAQAARADVQLVLTLLPADQQLEFLAAYEAEGAPATVTGMPHPDAQTREFFLAAHEASPTRGAGHRAIGWAATLDAYGARELNARYLARWDEPMELAGWGAYQAVKIFYEADTFSGGLRGTELRDYLLDENTVYDIWKGLGASFRPWDHQLRQSLYLIEVDPEAESLFAIEMLVGELPAIYMPGTDPVERLDQLGDLAANSGCNF